MDADEEQKPTEAPGLPKGGHETILVVEDESWLNGTVVRHGVLSEGTAFLQKPFTPETLVRKVREVLEG